MGVTSKSLTLAQTTTAQKLMDKEKETKRIEVLVDELPRLFTEDEIRVCLAYAVRHPYSIEDVAYEDMRAGT